MRVGNPDLLGATPDDSGTNFAVYSAVADGVELCLFSADGQQVITVGSDEALLWDMAPKTPQTKRAKMRFNPHGRRALSSRLIRHCERHVV